MNESTRPFTRLPFSVVQSGPWDPETFGAVGVEVQETEEGLEAVITSGDNPQIRFNIDSYEQAGDLLFLRTNASRKWIFRALN